MTSLLLPDDLALARIVAQRLVDPLPTAIAAVAHLGCVQAQDLPGALVSVALRTTSRSIDEVQQALDDGEVVRSWTMRGTLHLVPARELAPILGLTAPRMLRQAARRREQLGITQAVLDGAEAVTRRLLAGGGGATRARLLDAFDEAGLVCGIAQRGYHLLNTLAMQQVLVQGPTRRTANDKVEQLFVLCEDWLPRPGTAGDALERWAATYVNGHGPVRAEDLARWTALPLTACRAALTSSGAAVTVADGTSWHHDPDLAARLAQHGPAAAEVLLLPGFDELVLGYADRSCTVPEAFAPAIVPGNNGMFKATVVIDGRVVATWRKGTRRAEPWVVEWLVSPTSGDEQRVTAAFEQLPR